MEVDAIEKLFARLEVLTIDLPQDPLELGADYLREQISICRGYLNETSQHLQRILSERTLLTMRVEALEAEYQIRADELLTQDPRVKVLPSLTDRQAMISNILMKEKRDLTQLKLELQSNGHIEKVIRLRHKELDNTMSAIRLQRSLLKDQLRTGSFYGDESPQGRGEDELGKMSGEDLDAFLADAERDEVDAGAKDLVVDVEDEDEDFGDLSDEDSSEETVSSEEPESESEEVPEPEEASVPAEDDDLESTFGDLDLQDEIDALVEAGGTDETPPQDPPKKVKSTSRKDSKKKGDMLLVEDAPKLSAKDVDENMEGFLEEDFEDDLDSILDDV